MPQGEYRQLLRVIDRIYEASLDSAHWACALSELVAFTGAIAADLYITDTDHPPFISFTGISDELMHDYLAHFHDQNDRVKAIQLSSEGALVTDYDVTTPDEMARSPYYQDLLFKHGYGLFIGCNSLTRAGESALFGVHYGRGVDGYRKEHFRRLQLVMPHIRRAARLQNRIRTTGAKASRLAAAIDAVSSGIVLLDCNGEVVHCNLAAERLLSLNRGVRLRRRRVEIAQASLDRTLQRAIFEAIKRDPVSRGAGDAVSIDGETPTEALSLIVFPLPLRLSLEDCIGAIIVISEPFSRVPPAADVIVRAIFDLTPAEAQLAIALANGETVNSYAKRTGRSIETVRGQLKTIMGKTGVKRQSALVRLILNTLGGFPGSEGHLDLVSP